MHSLAYYSFRSLCPRCGQGKILHRTLKIVDACPVCGLSLKNHDIGDGATQLVIWIVGITATIGASIVEYMYAPPYWLQALIWFPLVICSSIWLLRVFKAMLLAIDYKNRPETFE